MAALEVDISGRAGSFAVAAAFRAEPGVTALFGRSGAGKSTILKMIAGTVRPERGRIAAGGRVLFDSETGSNLPPRARGIGFVFQEDRLFPHLSVRRNLTYARWAGRRTGMRAVEEVVALLGLKTYLDRYPETLSGGERQRVAIGRALLAEPQILLMDEPLSSLDRERRAEILPYLEAVADEARIPILYVSHDTDEVARLADRVVAIEAGRVVAAGTPAEILGHAGGEEDGPISFLDGEVVAFDAAYGTVLVETAGGPVELSANELPAGSRIRLRIGAGDIAIATAAHEGLSIRNQLRCEVEKVERRGNSAEVLLGFGQERLTARITAKSADALSLRPGLRVVALIKAISIERTRLLPTRYRGG
ncbi:molybdenum ABC transporter ATP-binding protein [Chelativorans sp.]|uniref:molybdenum ABC transporter ATP-binding protein n=1 Tax=Chelativorans sp. TaxID=2203393 RepID=UPI002810C78A|nr:molybdenum ABC transporter ATP-binding protein [Chelativorans sp.]